GLITEAAQIGALVAKKISVARDVEAVRTSTEVVLVLESFELAVCSSPEVMVHQVMTELTGATPETTRPDTSCRPHQEPGRVERRCAQEDDLRLVVGHLIVEASITRTPVARLVFLSYRTSLTIAHGLRVMRPVFAACGSVDDCELKYAPYGQPSQHAFRYWH